MHAYRPIHNEKAMAVQAHYVTVPLSSRRAAGVLGHDFKKMGLRSDQIDHTTYGSCAHPFPQTFHAVRSTPPMGIWCHGTGGHKSIQTETIIMEAGSLIPSSLHDSASVPLLIEHGRDNDVRCTRKRLVPNQCIAPVCRHAGYR